jgi:hypothetical protein
MIEQLPTPQQVAKKLFEAAEKDANTALQQDLIEGAETIRYLLILLKECSHYIEGVQEYEQPPRILIAAREALK